MEQLQQQNHLKHKEEGKGLVPFHEIKPTLLYQVQQRKHRDRPCPLVKTNQGPNTWSRYKVYYSRETEIQATDFRNALSKCCLLDMLVLN